MTRKTRSVLIAVATTFLALAFAPAAAFATNGKPGGGTGCSISPNAVVLDQVWTTSARGLPTSSTVNMIITFPDGGQLTGPITVSSDGTFTTTGNSNMSATWGLITPEQTGTYTYQFVGKVKWPAGTFRQSYAKCAVSVS